MRLLTPKHSSSNMDYPLSAVCMKVCKFWPTFCFNHGHTRVGSGSPNEESSKPIDGNVQHVRSSRAQLFRRSLNILAMIAVCASLLQPGHIWHKLLTANAMLCCFLKTAVNQSAAVPAPASTTAPFAMSTTLVFTLLEHSTVFIMTNWFTPNDPTCWKWLAISYVPVALFTSLMSRPIPGSQQDSQTHAIASLLHISNL